jgi:hypothetical protein
MADFFFTGAKATSFTILGTILTGALNGQFKDFDAAGFAVIAWICVGLAALSIMLLIAGWHAAGQDDKDAKKKSALPQATAYESRPAIERNDILLYSPAERYDGTPGVQVSIRASGAKKIAIVVSVGRAY